MLCASCWITADACCWCVFVLYFLFWSLIFPLGLTPYLSCHKNPAWLTSCILIDNSDRLPLVVLHYVQHSSAYGGVFRIEVDVEAVLVVHRGVFPAGLDVRDFQGVTNRLNRTDGWAVRRAKYGPNTQSQLVAGWSNETESGEKITNDQQERHSCQKQPLLLIPRHKKLHPYLFLRPQNCQTGLFSGCRRSMWCLALRSGSCLCWLQQI